jgi:hypothetical protein
MASEQGWNLPAATARQIRLLEDLVDGHHDADYYVELPDWANAQSPGFAIAVTDLELFDDSGFVKLSRGLTLPPRVHMLAPGIAQVEKIRGRRGDRRERNQQARDALLGWLHDCDLAGIDHPLIRDFVQSPFGRFYGQPFEEAEVDRAATWLADLGYISGTALVNGTIPAASITAKGIRLAEADVSVNDPGPHAGPSVVTHITGNYNAVQAASPGASMQVTTTITDDHRQQTIELAKAIEEAAPVLSPEAGQVAAALLTAIEAGQADPGMLKRALEGAKTTLSTGAGNLVGRLILAGFGGLLAHYGISVS